MDDQTKNLLTILVLVGLLAVIVGASTSGKDRVSENLSDISKNDTVKAIFKQNNETLGVLMLEKAETEEERRQGLMYRMSLEDGKGMLFSYEEEGNRSFWMKNTYIPLDMIFVTAEKTVRTIKQADPQPNVTEEELRIYTSEGPAKYVIETNQNFSETKGIEEGTNVIFK